jgi:signal transduction histidine kinase
MWFGIRDLGGHPWLGWLGLFAGGAITGVLALLGLRAYMEFKRRGSERRHDEELQAYAHLDVRLSTDGEIAGLARRVTRLMAEKSRFARTAMLLRSPEGQLSVAASEGMDGPTMQELNQWGAEATAKECKVGFGVQRGDGSLGVRLGTRSFAVVLGQGPVEGAYRRAVVIPLWTNRGRMLGALVVGADGLMNVRRGALVKALEPLESLALKMERVVENAGLMERLSKAEKLAGLGLLTGGMAHELSTPLTAVLGFAELIAHTTDEARVKEDAGIVVREALRMRQTVETLQEFWRPAARNKELVDVTELVRELAGACAGKLQGRGLRLVVEAGEESAVVRGNGDRLRQMLEHLLNNAAQALAGGSAANAREERVIRVSVGQNREMVHLLVSDTGPGFREPGLVFELSDTMRAAGLGLNICYWIAQEHGGEISAFNLHPHGAAVAVELPSVGLDIKKSDGARARVGSLSA